MVSVRRGGRRATGGYDALFVDTLPDRLTCVICHLGFKEPTELTECGHAFCRDCLTALPADDGAKCPVCAVAFDKDALPPFSKRTQREVLALRVKCRDCRWQGALGERSGHPCPADRVNCRAGCNWRGRRDALPGHQRTECGLTEVPCDVPGCTVRVPRKDLEAHYPDPMHMGAMARKLRELEAALGSMRLMVVSNGDTLVGPAVKARSLLVLNDGDTIVTGSLLGTVSVWRGGERVNTFEAHDNHVTALAEMDDGKLVTGSGSGAVTVWDTATHSPVHATQAHTKFVSCLAALPDGTFASGSGDGLVKLWRGGDCVATLRGHTSTVTGLAVLPGGILASSSNDTTLRLWRDGACIATLSGHDGRVTDIVALPDGTLASCSRDKTVKLWRDGVCVSTLTGHTARVCGVAVLPNGTLASCSSDKTVKLWRDSACVGTLKGHDSAVNSVVARRDGSLATLAADCTVKVWRV